MSKSLDDILQKINMNKEDLRSLYPYEIQEIFLDLSVGEISRLCRVNKEFNSVCERESLWKNKIWMDYGLEEKFTSTWRKMAKILFEYKMINLNERWVDGKSYKEILGEVIKKESDGRKYVEDMIMDETIKIEEKSNTVDFTDLGVLFSKDTRGRNNFTGMTKMLELTRDQIDDLRKVFSIEMFIILAVAEQYIFSLSPSDMNYYSRDKSSPPEGINPNIMPNPYVYAIEFSSFCHGALDIVAFPDIGDM